LPGISSTLDHKSGVTGQSPGLWAESKLRDTIASKLYSITFKPGSFNGDTNSDDYKTAASLFKAW
jgi:hypothetical protein